MRRYFLAAFFVAGVIFAFGALTSPQAFAANCGGGTACNCGDTVIASTTLASDLVCSGDGLNVGTSSITIDGNSHSITGSNSSTQYNGIGNLSNYSNLIIKNFANITGFTYGIYMSGTNLRIQSSTVNANASAGVYLGSVVSSTVTGVTANNNRTYGIQLSGGSSSTISNNITNYNYGDIANGNGNAGIGLVSSATNNILTGNVSNGNSKYGILLSFSNNNTLSGNSMSGNRIGNLSNFALFGTGETIDSTNLVEGKKVYYLSNISNQTYDDATSTYNIGMFWCFTCVNVTVKNATLADNSEYAVMFKNSTSSVAQNLAISRATFGVYLSTSNSSTIDSNSISFGGGSSGGAGININGGKNNAVTNNTLTSNNYGLQLVTTPATTTVSNNTFFQNQNEIKAVGGSTAIYANNSFLHSLNKDNAMLTFTETSSSRTKSVGDTISFDMSLFDPNGNSCSGCSYTIATSPAETVTSNLASNRLTGSFTVSRSGTYSLLVTVTDTSGNVAKHNYRYFVNAASSATSRHYIRYLTGQNGQTRGNGMDSEVLSLTAPTSTEAFWCSGWVQSSPSDIPSYPLSSLSGASTSIYYSMQVGGFNGIQRFATYVAPNGVGGSNATTTLATSTGYSVATSSFSSLNWAMDYPQSWYDLAVKFGGNTSSFLTTLQTSAATSSLAYIDFRYSYSTTPTIYSIANPNVILLSATASSTATSTASLVLDNPFASPTSTSIILQSWNRPFQNATTTIGFNSTSTVAAQVGASTSSTLPAVDMTITPSGSASVDVGISLWDTTSSAQHKTWSEVSATPSATSSHTISSLTPGKVYLLTVNNTTTAYTANASGTITFVYTGGY